MRFALARGQVDRLRTERRARKEGRGQPMNIRLLLDHLAAGQISTLSAINPPSDSIGISYHFHLELLIWAARGRPYLILVWGLPPRGFLRNHIRRYLLLRAKHVLVNDPLSALEVKAASGRYAKLIPYVVDPDFFSFAHMEERDTFLFCPSSIDRDPEVLCALAALGHKVIWLNNDPLLADRYSRWSSNLEIVSQISFDELRRLYMTCRAVILPLKQDVHAAGQTTALEAIASGAPVFVSRGRTSEIFAVDKLVSVVGSGDIELWLQALERPPLNYELERRRGCVVSRNGPASVGKELLSLLGRTEDLRSLR